MFKPGELTDGHPDGEIHPYMKNNWQGTPEIQETFKRISKRHEVKSY